MVYWGWVLGWYTGGGYWACILEVGTGLVYWGWVLCWYLYYCGILGVGSARVSTIVVYSGWVVGWYYSGILGVGTVLLLVL